MCQPGRAMVRSFCLFLFLNLCCLQGEAIKGRVCLLLKQWLETQVNSLMLMGFSCVIFVLFFFQPDDFDENMLQRVSLLAAAATDPTLADVLKKEVARVRQVRKSSSNLSSLTFLSDSQNAASSVFCSFD